MKLAIKRACHADIAAETITLLSAKDSSPETVLLDKTIGTLRNRSPNGFLLGIMPLMIQCLFKGYVENTYFLHIKVLILLTTYSFLLGLPIMCCWTFQPLIF